MLPKDFKVESYVDIGCGNCQITDQISQALSASRTVAADIAPYERAKYTLRSCKTKMHYVQIDQQRSKVNVRTSSVDLVTCYMSIHHFEAQAAMFAEIKRILKPDGFLFVREHDA